VAYRRWTPLKFLQSFVGAALLFIGVFVSVAGFGFLFDHSTTVPHQGHLTNDFWTKAIYPAIGVILTIVGALLWLGYPHRTPRQDKDPTRPAAGS